MLALFLKMVALYSWTLNWKISISKSNKNEAMGWRKSILYTLASLLGFFDIGWYIRWHGCWSCFIHPVEYLREPQGHAPLLPTYFLLTIAVLWQFSVQFRRQKKFFAPKARMAFICHGYRMASSNKFHSSANMRPNLEITVFECRTMDIFEDKCRSLILCTTSVSASRLLEAKSNTVYISDYAGGCAAKNYGAFSKQS